MKLSALETVRREVGGRTASVFPVVDWLPDYDRTWLRFDVVAGVTVAASVIPEGLAYAALAGLPPQTGLYAGLLATVTYFFVGTSRQLIVGPTSALAILLASGVGSVAAGSGADYATLVALTTLLVGLMAVLAWAFRLGFLVNFVSASVLTGFSTGAALYIVSTQLGTLFGIEGSTGEFYERVWFVATHLGETNLPTLAVGLGGVALFVLGKRVLPRAPTALVVVLLSIVVASVTDLPSRGLDLVGAVPSGLPSLSVPTAVSPATVGALVPIAVGLFLLSYVQGIGAVETFARRHGYRADAEQELFADGVANLAAGLGSGFVVGGSMSRSSLNDSAGGRTPLASGVVAVVLVVVLLFLTDLFTTLPDATLAAVVIVAVGELVDLPGLRRLYRLDPGEFAVAAGALLGVLVFGMLWGVFVGVALSLLIVVGRISDPHTETLGRVPGTDHFASLDHHPAVEPVPGALVYRVDAELFYANASRVRADLTDRVRTADDSLDVVVFDLASSPSIDLAAAETLVDLHRSLSSTGVDLRFAGATGQVRALLTSIPTATTLGEIREDESVASVLARGRERTSE